MREEFVEILDINQQILHKLCRIYRDNKEDQEDLFQDMILQLWKAYPSFKKESKVTTWMYRIALNTAIATFRKKRISLTFRQTINDELHPVEPAISLDESKEEQLFRALRQLNDSDKAIIALYLEEYSHREIGDLLGITENYVGVKISRIKTKLTELLKTA